MNLCYGRPAGIVVLALLFLLFHPAYAQAVNIADVDPLNHCKRGSIQLAEHNNKVYIYGGKMWVANGTDSEAYRVTNHYLRIADFTTPRDLSDRSILSIKDIPGNITIFQEGVFWVDSEHIYVAGGSVNEEPWQGRDGKFYESNYTAHTGNTIFSYELATDIWSSENAAQPNSGPHVNGPFCCGSFAHNAVSQKAYFYSGTNNAGARKKGPKSSPSPVDGNKIVGNTNLLTLDTASFTWSNVTIDAETTLHGRFVFLPGTLSGEEGIGVLIGGAWRNMSTIQVYDPATESWYYQATTVDGVYPRARMNFCAVAASSSDNSVHNIYMYGGESDVSASAFSDLWILSLPSFHWIRISADSLARKALGCTVVGQRYMLTYGGSTAGWLQDGDVDPCDQDNYGLRLFDMSSLAWTKRYDGPSSYRVPKAVYDFVGGNEQGHATRTTPIAGFNTPGLESLFRKLGTMKATATATTAGVSSTTRSTQAASGKASNIGPIIGGVIGGIVGLTLLLAGILCLLRKSKKHEDASGEPSNQDGNIGELPANTRPPHEIYNERDEYATEMCTAREPREMYSSVYPVE